MSRSGPENEAEDTLFEVMEISRPQISALLESGHLDIATAISRLSDGRVHVRRNAALAALVHGELTADQIAQLQIAAKDSDALVRQHCVELFGNGTIADPIALPIVVGALADHEGQAREMAVTCLTRLLAHRFNRTSPYVVSALSDERPIIQITTMELITACGERGLLALIEAMGHEHPVVRRVARQAVRLQGRLAATPLIEALRRPELRAPALLLIEKMTDFDREHEALLIAMCREGDVRLRVSANRAIRAVSKAIARTLERPPELTDPAFYERVLERAELEPLVAGLDVRELLWTLNDGRDVVRANSVALIGLMGVDASSRVPVMEGLAQHVRDPSPYVRGMVVQVLGSFGGPEAVPPLVLATIDRNQELVAAAQRALNKLARTVVDTLLGALKRSQPARQYHAVREALEAAGRKAVPRLVTAVEEGADPMVRELAARVIGSLPVTSPRQIGTLCEALGDRHEAVRYRAAWALGRIAEREDPAVVDALEQVLTRDTDRGVRRAAWRALKAVRGEALDAVQEAKPLPLSGFDQEPLTIEQLSAHLERLDRGSLETLLFDGRALVRRNAALALGTLGEAAARSAPKLLLALKDADVAVRIAAAQSLGVIRPDPGECVPALAAALPRAPEQLEGVLVAALVRYGQRAVAPLIGTLSQRPHLVMATVGRVAALFDEDLALPLCACLERGVARNQRRNAVDILWMMGPKARSATPALLEALDEPKDALFVTKSIRALGRIAPDDPEVVTALRDIALGDPRASVGQAATDVLRRLKASKGKAKGKGKRG